jgi:hypothetical protein
MEDLLGSAATVASGGLTGIFSFLGGAIARLASTWISMVEKDRERAHELEMTRLNGDLAAKASERQLRELQVVQEGQRYIADVGVMQTGMLTQVEMVKAAGRWIVDLSASVRPVITYMLLSYYLSVKYAQVLLCMHLTGKDAVSALLQVHTPLDTALLCTVMGFWFADRALMRQGQPVSA